MAISDAVEKSYARLERQVLQVAEAMPAEGYSFQPSAEVRTFGEQLRHLGAVQWVVGASILGSKPPADVGDGDSGPPAMTEKPEILRYVRDSFGYIRRAIQTVTIENALELMPHPYNASNTEFERLAMVVGYACHGWNHYGQMVVYQRLNSIIPPVVDGGMSSCRHIPISQVIR
jgi:hypothetical protein